MAGDDGFAIIIPGAVRDEMATPTPDWYAWTYHHILPVGTFHTAAWTMLRVAMRRDCPARLRGFARDMLVRMSNNKQNEQKIVRFVGERVGERIGDGDFNAIVRLCSSPWFGGFGGPKPEQRTDDPGAGREKSRPLSMSTAAWAAINRIGQIVDRCFQAAPDGARRSEVLPSALWHDQVDSLCMNINVAHHDSYPIFDGSDWVLVPGATRRWTLAPPATIAAGTAWQRVRVRLRDISEPKSFVETMVGGALPPGGVLLAARGGLLYPVGIQP